MWPDVGVKSIPNVSKSCQKSSHSNFNMLMRFFKIPQKVENNFATFFLNFVTKNLKKFQSGHTIFDRSCKLKCWHSALEGLLIWPLIDPYLGLRDALFLLAKARYLAGDIKAALSTLQHLVDNLDPTMAEGWSSWSSLPFLIVAQNGWPP